MSQRILHIVLTNLFFINSVIGFSQSERVEINPYSQEFLIGEQVRVELNVVASNQEAIIWPKYTDTVTTQIEIIESSKIDTLFQDSLTKEDIIGYQKQWVITSFDSGLWSFPEATVWIDSIPYTTNAFFISVNTIEVDTAKGHIDIIEPIEVPMTVMEYIQAYYHYVLIAIAIIMILAIIAYFIGSDAKNDDKLAPKIIIPAHIIALQRLEQLESEQLWQSGAVKAYHIQISDIIREYIENRFHIPVKESTTDEIKHLLKTIRIDKELRNNTIESLRISDLVKFAKSIPLPNENEDCLQTAHHLIESTKLVEPTTPETEGNE